LSVSLYIQDQLVLKLLQLSEFVYVVRQAGLEPATNEATGPTTQTRHLNWPTNLKWF